MLSNKVDEKYNLVFEDRDEAASIGADLLEVISYAMNGHGATKPALQSVLYLAQTLMGSLKE